MALRPSAHLAKYGYAHTAPCDCDGHAPARPPVAAPRVLSSVTPYAAPDLASAQHDGHAAAYRDSQVGAFISSVANGYLAGATFGASAARYVVGGNGDSVVISRGADRADRTASAVAFVADKGVWQIDAWNGIGYWFEEVSGRTWLDSVRCFAALSDAKRVARANGERAIYDAREDLIIWV